MKRRKSNYQRLRSVLLKGCALLLLLIALSVLYFSTFGFPEWLVAKCIGGIKSDNFVVEVARGRLDLLRGIVLNDVRLYRKGVVGPPVVDAEKLVAGVDILGFLGGGPILDQFTLSSGELRPVMLSDLRASTSDEDDGIHMLLGLEDFVVQGLGIEMFTGALSASKDTVRVDDIEFIVSEGTLSGPATGAFECDRATGDVSGRIETRFDPHILLGFLEARGMRFPGDLIQRFEFGDRPPRFDMAFSRKGDNDHSLAVSGGFWIEECLYRGIDLMRADGVVNVALSPSKREVIMDRLLLVREEGNLRTQFSYDMDSRLVKFDASSAVHPPALLQMLNVATNLVEYFSFDGPVSIAGGGVADTGSYTNMDFNVNIDGRGVGFAGFVTDSSRCELRLKGPTGEVSNLNGRLYGGEFSGNVGFVLPSGDETNASYEVNGEVRDIDAASVREVVTKKAAPEGKRGTLSGRATLSGLLGEHTAVTLKGNGSLRVKDSQVFSLPIFGGLSELMRKIVPGLGFVVGQSDFKTEFSIADKKVTTEKVLIEGDVLSLSGKGAYDFDGSVDFDVQLRLLKAHTVVGKLMRVITYPISKLFEFRLRGTLDDPRWYPVNFSSDILEKVGLKDKKSPTSK